MEINGAEINVYRELHLQKLTLRGFVKYALISHH